MEGGRVAAAGSASFVASVVRDRLDDAVSHDTGNAGDNMNSAQIVVWNQLQPIDPAFAGQRLQPHALPDAAGGRVPDAARLPDLLASRLRAGLGRPTERN